jgi:hypothetical protein
MALFAKKDKLLNSLRDDFDAAKEVQETYDGEWKLCLAFLGGAQYTQYDRTRRTIDEAPRPTTPRRRRRPVHNLIAPNFDIVTSKLGAFIPHLIALASSPEKNDISASKIATALLYYQRQKTELNFHIQDFIDVLVALGTAIIWGQYNPFYSPPININLFGENAVINSGEVEYKVLMPWQVFPDPTAYKPREARWTELLDIVDRDEAAGLWGVSKDKLPEMPETGLRSYSEFYIPMSHNSAPIINKKRRRDKPPTVIHHRFDKPSKTYPRGRWVVWTENAVLYSQEELPYGMDDFPFAVARYRCLPSRYWGRGLVSDLVQPQITRNFNLGRMAEYMDMMAFPPVLNPRGAIHPKDRESWTGDPGQMLDYNPIGAEPHYMQGPPGFNMTEFGVASADMGEISNIPPVVKGISPARERISGTAVNSLRAEHQEALGKPLKEIIHAYEHMGKLGLHIAAEHYEDSRVFYILGPQRTQQWFALGINNQANISQENQITFEDFRAMIRSGIDVIVEADPGTPMTRQERQEFALSLLDRLGRMNPMFMPMAIKMLSAGGVYSDFWAMLEMGAFGNMMGGPNPQEMGQQMAQQAAMQGGGANTNALPPELLQLVQAEAGGI